MKVELSVVEIIGMKIGLWIYRVVISRSSLVRHQFLCLPNSAAQEVPRSLSSDECCCVSWGSPRATPQGEPLTPFIHRVSNCIQMEDVMTSATRTEYRETGGHVYENNLLILL